MLYGVWDPIPVEHQDEIYDIECQQIDAYEEEAEEIVIAAVHD
jgi:hypothetical protein